MTSGEKLPIDIIRFIKNEYILSPIACYILINYFDFEAIGDGIQKVYFVSGFFRCFKKVISIVFSDFNCESFDSFEVSLFSSLLI